MTHCRTCPKHGSCRVPSDLQRFKVVAHRLERDHRQPMLQERLHHFIEHPACLVEAGYIDR